MWNVLRAKRTTATRQRRGMWTNSLCGLAIRVSFISRDQFTTYGNSTQILKILLAIISDNVHIDLVATEQPMTRNDKRIRQWRLIKSNQQRLLKSVASAPW